VSDAHDIPGSSSTNRPLGPLIVEERPCAACGYNLQGLRIGGACPECGDAIRAEEAFEVDGDAKPDRPRRCAVAGPVGSNRSCPGCGYDLEGLQIGGVCPECGRTITFAIRTRSRATFLDAPILYIRVVHVALLLMTLGMISGVGALVSGSWLGAGADLMLMGASVAWLTGLVIITWPGPRTRAAERDEKAKLHWWLSVAACVTQSGWVGAATLSALPVGGAIAQWGVAGLGGLGAIGFIPTAWTLGQVAGWAGDDDRARFLELVAIWVLFFGTLSFFGIELPLPVLIPGIYIGDIDGITIAVWMAIGYSLWSVVKLTTVLGWGVRRAVLEKERTQRFIDRFRQERAAGGADMDRQPFGGPVEPPVGSMMDIRKRPRG